MTQEVNFQRPTEHSVKWEVSLSNGKTFQEDKGDFVLIAGELSPWNKLLKYIEENQVSITSFALINEHGQVFHLPSTGRQPKLRLFDMVEKPVSFKFGRRMATNLDGSGDDLFTFATAVYPTYELSIYVDENNTNNCWSVVDNLKGNI
jgi:hypothetical protein